MLRAPIIIARAAIGLGICLVACGGNDDDVKSGVTATGDVVDATEADSAKSDVPGPGDTDSNAAQDTSVESDSGTSAFDAATDTGPAAIEKCVNFQDDDGDGLIDEGCYPAPNLRGDQAWIDMGVHEVKPSDATGPKVKFTLPANGHRGTAVARDVSKPHVMVAGDWLTHPNGQHILGPSEWSKAPGRGAGGLGGATLFFGSSNVTTLAQGTWTAGFRRTHNLSNSGPGPLQAGFIHVGALLSKPAKPAAAIDLDIYLLGGQPQPAKTMASSVLWSRIRARVNAIWKPAGIAVGKVTFTDIGGSDGQKFLHVDNVLAVDDTNELNTLWSLGAKLKPASTAVALYIVSSLNHAGQAAAAGITGQIGGVNGLAGNRLSGIALSMSATTVKKFHATDPSAKLAGAYFGDRLAHEIGHHLGLWHTTERPGDLHDLVTDTAECALKSGHSMVLAEHCPKSGDNLMFWAPKGTSISAGQAKVSRRHGSIH